MSGSNFFRLPAAQGIRCVGTFPLQSACFCDVCCLIPDVRMPRRLCMFVWLPCLLCRRRVTISEFKNVWYVGVREFYEKVSIKLVAWAGRGSA